MYVPGLFLKSVSYLKQKILRKGHGPYVVWYSIKCLIDVIERECECSSFLFPRNRNATKQLKSCGFIQQVNIQKLKRFRIVLTLLMESKFFSHCVSHDMSKNSTILDANVTRNADTVSISFNPSIYLILDPERNHSHLICISL